ncbi:hypothetical protein HKBW3S42_02233, partial [Candidatus Hakubella thermalkaliphila]
LHREGQKAREKSKKFSTKGFARHLEDVVAERQDSSPPERLGDLAGY